MYKSVKYENIATRTALSLFTFFQGLKGTYFCSTEEMEKRIIQTADGSKSIELTGWEETYHSRHGAWQESQHVFIQQGLAIFPEKKIRVFEMGFGTGLNAIQALLFAEQHELVIEYSTVEAYPIEPSIWKGLDYESLLPERRHQEYWRKMHEMEAEVWGDLGPHFRFIKYLKDIRSFLPLDAPDVVFYDAFGPRVQPELWEIEIYKRLFNRMTEGGVLSTYCAKGQVRRDLQAVGFEVERLPGPPGKREMLRATKPKEA